MTTQEIISEHTRRVTLAVQTAERARLTTIIEADIVRHRELGLHSSAAYLEYLVERVNGEQK
jgi:hypothetical protein